MLEEIPPPVVFAKLFFTVPPVIVNTVSDVVAMPPPLDLFARLFWKVPPEMFKVDLVAA